MNSSLQNQASSTILEILRIALVVKRTGLSRSTVYAKLNRHSSSFDPQFPRQFAIGPRARGWLSSEIDEWVKTRAALRANGAVTAQGGVR